MRKTQTLIKSACIYAYNILYICDCTYLCTICYFLRERESVCVLLCVPMYKHTHANKVRVNDIYVYICMCVLYRYTCVLFYHIFM